MQAVLRRWVRLPFLGIRELVRDVSLPLGYVLERSVERLWLSVLGLVELVVDLPFFPSVLFGRGGFLANPRLEILGRDLLGLDRSDSDLARLAWLGEPRRLEFVSNGLFMDAVGVLSAFRVVLVKRGLVVLGGPGRLVLFLFTRFLGVRGFESFARFLLNYGLDHDLGKSLRL